MKDSTEDNIIQNLKDAGCSEEKIEKFMKMKYEADKNGQIKILSKCRCELLETVHKDQKKLDCLDFLLYNLKNTEK